MSEVYPFSHKGCTSDKNIWNRSGKRGQRAFELAELGTPIVPGFIIDALTSLKLESMDVKDLVSKGLKDMEEGIGRKYGDTSNPLLVKVVCSSNLSLPFYPTVFNIGLSPVTIPGFAGMIGEAAAWYEYCYLIRTAGAKLYDIEPEKFTEIEKKHERTAEGNKACAMEMLELLGKDKLPDDPMEQLVSICKIAAKKYFDPDLDEDDNIALMIQAMVFGNLGEDSCVGMYYTRDIVSGDDKLQGSYLLNSYTLDKEGEDISKLDSSYLTELQAIGKNLQKRFRDIREVKFIVEKKKLWIINQTDVDNKSTQA